MGASLMSICSAIEAIVRYDGIDTDARGIAEMGPLRCAWFHDPCGNAVAVSQFVSVPA